MAVRQFPPHNDRRSPRRSFQFPNLLDSCAGESEYSFQHFRLVLKIPNHLVAIHMTIPGPYAAGRLCFVAFCLGRRLYITLLMYYREPFSFNLSIEISPGVPPTLSVLSRMVFPMDKVFRLAFLSGKPWGSGWMLGLSRLV